MKKIILIISAALLIVGIAGCAILALPVAVQGEKYMNDKLEKNMKTTTYTFEESKEDSENTQYNKYVGIDMTVLSAKTVFSYNNDGKTVVKYTASDKNKKLDCRIDKGELIIHEIQDSFLFPMFTFNLVPAKIEISLPERYRCSKKLDYMEMYIASGSVTGDIPFTEKSDISLASGVINSTAQAQDLTLDVASGSVELTGRYGENSVISGDLKVDCKSGKVVLNGLNAARNEFKVSSGSVEATGVSGTIRSDLMSGSLSIYCTGEITEAELDMASGRTYIALPKNTKAKIDYSTASGSVDVKLGGNEQKLTKTGTAVYNGEAPDDDYGTYIATSVLSGKCVIEEIAEN